MLIAFRYRGFRKQMCFKIKRNYVYLKLTRISISAARFLGGINGCCKTICDMAQTPEDPSSISKAPFLTIVASLKRGEKGLFNEAKIVTNGTLRDRDKVF